MGTFDSPGELGRRLPRLTTYGTRIKVSYGAGSEIALGREIIFRIRGEELHDGSGNQG